MPEYPEPPERPTVRTPREAVQRWRLVLARGPLEGDVGQREQLAAWDRALEASGLPVAGLDASPPRPRFAPAAPLAAAIPGEAELADVWLTERVPAWRLREQLGASVPAGYRLVDSYDVWLGAAALPGQVVASVYRAAFAPGAVDTVTLRAAAGDLLRAQSLPRERRKGQAMVEYDLRPFLDGLEVAGADATGIALRMTLRHDPERGIGRPDEVLAALGERLREGLEPASLVRECLVLALPPVPSAPGPRPRIQRDGSAQTGRRRP